ncbi:MAG: GNAT family N-acetyltransferase [Patescibacteria group bacterium]
MEFVYKKATIEDVPILQQLNHHVFLDNQQHDDDLVMDWATGENGKNYFTKIVSNPEAFCMIARDGEKAVGYISCQEKKLSYRKSKTLEIDNMGVSPDYRSRGIGATLIERAKEWGRRQGCRRMFVSTYFHSPKAVAFYKRNGFAEIDLGLQTNL